MKLRNLLVLGALFVAGSASAALADGVRQIPESPKANVTAQEIKFGEAMYMYNVNAGQFFLGANDWNTRASVGRKGYKVYLDQYVADGATEWDGKEFYWRDSVETQSAIKHVFMADEGGNMWVDNSNEANRLYNLVPQGNNVYRIAPGLSNPTWNSVTYPDVYVGTVKANLPGENTRLFWNISPATEGAQIDWIFVSVEDYNAAIGDYTAAWGVYDSLLTVYNTAESLKAQMEEATAKGIDVSAYEPVYNNTASTLEELEAAISAVKALLAQLEEGNVDPNNPIDKTSAITNPGYDENKNDGWSGTSLTGCNYSCAEHYNKTFDTWQMLTGIPNGVYKLTIQGFYRPTVGGATGAVFYAAGADSVTTPVPNINSAGLATTPNNMETSGAAFAEGAYTTSLYFFVTDNKARIGIALPKKSGDTDWVIWDSWSLLYYGNSEASFGAMAGSLVENFTAEYEASSDFQTLGLLEAAQEAISAVTVKDFATYKEVVAVIDAQKALLDANVAAWTEYKSLYEEGDVLIADPNINQNSDYTLALADYIMLDGEEIYGAMEMETEALLAEIETLAKLVDDVKKKALLDNADVTTKFLVNADYSQGTTGWSGSWTAVASGCMEAYQRDWDAYQIVEGAPQGVYEVSLQGFYRVARGNDAFNMWLNNQQECPGHVYINNNQTPVKCVFSEPVKLTENIYSGTTSGGEGNFCAFEDPAVPGDTLVFPNDMKSAGEAFAAGMFEASANGVVAKDGESLRLGVKGKKQTATWVIWDNFKMIFRGKQVKYVKPHLVEAIANAEVNLSKNMDASTREAVAKAKASAETLLESTDEDAVFQALVDLYALNDSVAASIELYDELLTTAEALYDDIAMSQAGQSVIDEAASFVGTVQSGIDAGIITKAQAEVYMKECALWKIKLRLPDVAGASVENPIDVTNVLINPDFGDAMGTNSVDGWDGTSGYNFGNDDTQKAALALEFYEKTFDMSQTLIGGLPNGTYRVEVNAFGRLGSTDGDYALFTSAPDTLPASRALIYAMSAGDSTTLRTVPVQLLGSGAVSENLSEGSATIADSLYVPGSMVSSVAWFSLGYYKNTLNVNVVDGSLRIGIKKAESEGSHWVIMDNWKLFYLGANSAEGIENVELEAAGEVVNVAIFNANGAQIEKFQSGLNIIRTVYANGAVTVKKVMVK